MLRINIKATNIDLTAEIKDYVENKFCDLDKYFQGILQARVEVGKTSQHHQQGKIFRAEANFKIPKGVVRAEAIEENLYSAIDRVKEDIKRQLIEHKEKSKN